MHGVTTRKPLKPKDIISFNPSLIPINMIPIFKIYLMQNVIPKSHKSANLVVFAIRTPIMRAKKIGEIGLFSNCRTCVPKSLLKNWLLRAIIKDIKMPIEKLENLFFMKGFEFVFLLKLNSITLIN